MFNNKIYIKDINPLHVLNHYFQYGRDQNKKAYCIKENGEKKDHRFDKKCVTKKKNHKKKI